MTEDDEKKFQKAKICYICEEKFSIISDYCNRLSKLPLLSELYKNIRKSCSTCNMDEIDSCDIDENDSCKKCQKKFEHIIS